MTGRADDAGTRPSPTQPTPKDPYDDEITSEETAEALRRFNLKREPNSVDPKPNRCTEILHIPTTEEGPCMEFRCVLTTKDHRQIADHSYEGTTEDTGKIVWFRIDWEVERRHRA